MPHKEPEKRRKYRQAYEKLDRVRNPEKWRARARKKYLKHKDARTKYAREYRLAHKDKVKEAIKKWREENKEKVLDMRKRWYEKHAPTILQRHKSKNAEYRRIVLLHYGGDPPKCSCCEESNYVFLTIEHKSGGGTRHRKNIGPANMARWIIQNNFPSEFDVLCYNCNCAKSFSGICPHKGT